MVTSSEPQSISRETTFERDLHAVRDRAALSDIFTALCEALSADLTRKGYAGRTIGIKLRFEDFKTVTRGLTLPTPVVDAAAIREAAGQCLKRVDLSRKLRLLGVREHRGRGESDQQGPQLLIHPFQAGTLAAAALGG